MRKFGVVFFLLMGCDTEVITNRLTENQDAAEATGSFQVAPKATLTVRPTPPPPNPLRPKTCCACFYEEQSGCAGLPKTAYNKPYCGSPTDEWNCAWYDNKCISNWEQECHETVKSCDFKTVKPKSKMNDPIGFPSDCTTPIIAHKGHGTGFQQCIKTATQCLVDCPSCTESVYINWGGCHTLSGYEYDESNPNDPLNVLKASLPDFCNATVKSSPTTDARGCRQNYYTLEITNCRVTNIRPPNCGGSCARNGETETCIGFSGKQTTQACCRNIWRQGKTDCAGY